MVDPHDEKTEQCARRQLQKYVNLVVFVNNFKLIDGYWFASVNRKNELPYYTYVIVCQWFKM